MIADGLIESFDEPAARTMHELNTPGGFSPIEARTGKPATKPDDPGGFIYRGGEPDLFAALGAGRNRLYIVPGRKLVALRQTRGRGDRFSDREFLARLLGGDRVDARVRRAFDRLDGDEDGRLTREELPERMRPAFRRLDADGDGGVSPAEFQEAIRRRR
jgi:hypothetical protein